MQSDAHNTCFGDPGDFAIEAGVEPDLRPPSAVWGRMRVWCAGVPLGNIDGPYCALYGAYAGFRWIRAHLDELWDDAFAERSDQELWTLLDRALYGFHGSGISVPATVAAPDDEAARAAAAAARYDKFEFLTSWGEQFDGYPAFLICPPGGACRVIFQTPATRDPCGLEVSRGGLVAACEQFGVWFEEQERRLLPNGAGGMNPGAAWGQRPARSRRLT